MVGADLRLHFRKLIHFVELFSTLRRLHRRLVGHPWNLILRQGWGTCMVAGRLRNLLKFLLRDYVLFLACVVEIGHSSIDVVHDGPNRRWRPIGHTVGILNIFGLLSVALRSRVVRAKLAAMIVLDGSRVGQADLVVRLAEGVLRSGCRHTTLSCHLVKHFVVLVVWRWFCLDLVRVPLRGYYIIKGKS